MKRSRSAGLKCLPLLSLLACGQSSSPDERDRELLPEPDRALRLRGELVRQLQGHWWDQGRNGDQEFHEVWSSNGSGIGYVMVGGDTVWTEQLALRSNSVDDLEYVATVPDQNGGGSVPFQWRASNDSTLLFVNEAHDFPQRIAYVRNGSGWRVTLTGTEKEEAREERFEFVPHPSASPE